ncbi:unnamed protein product [Arctia plantaginis]|uniref:Endonuclease/exonuclease/phosphatase domain-containing protein n=1 Tax=Arctia plantaginis TaxID=874455 RepID=A0A8S0YRI3_ARCPL|nr:unnamed protein product [Arctia plantaginis]
MDSLRVVHWNADSLKGKVGLLRLFLKEQRVDVMLISETYLKSKLQLRIPGYFVYRQDEVTPQGEAYRGLAVLVKRTLVHQAVEPKRLDTLYALGVDIQVGGGEMRLYAAYRAPSTPLRVQEVRDLLLTAPPTTPTIVAGDLNAKHQAWHNTTSNTTGKQLVHDASTYGYEIAGPREPTRLDPVRPHRDSVLDIVVYRGLRAPPTQEVLTDLPSDHPPVLLVFREPATTTGPPKSLVHTDWATYHQTLAAFERPALVKTPEEVDAAAVEISRTLQTALRASSSTRPRSETDRTHCHT